MWRFKDGIVNIEIHRKYASDPLQNFYMQKGVERAEMADFHLLMIKDDYNVHKRCLKENTIEPE